MFKFERIIYLYLLFIKCFKIKNMSYLKALLKIEKIEQVYELAKSIALEYGALKSSFVETDKRLKEVNDLIKSKIEI